MPMMTRRAPKKILPFLPVPPAEDLLAPGAEGNPDASAPPKEIPRHPDGRINWAALLIPALGAGLGAAIGGKTGAAMGATATTAGALQGYGQEKIRQQEFGFQQEQEAARQKAEADRLALGKEQLSATRDATELENTRWREDRNSRENLENMERLRKEVEAASGRVQRESEFQRDLSSREKLEGVRQKGAIDVANIGAAKTTKMTKEDYLRTASQIRQEELREDPKTARPLTAIVKDLYSAGQILDQLESGQGGGEMTDEERVKHAVEVVKAGKYTLQQAEQEILALPLSEERKQKMIDAVREQAKSAGATPGAQAASQPFEAARDSVLSELFK